MGGSGGRRRVRRRPERVLATLVDGEARYERGGFEWHELIDAAAAARSRMLRPPPPRQRPRSHRGHPLLHPDPPAREVGVRVPRPLVPDRIRGLQRRRLGKRRRHRRASPGRRKRRRAATSPSRTRASRCRRHPQSAQAQRNLATALESRRRRPTRRSSRSRATSSSSRRTRTRCASSPASTSGRAASSPRRRRSPSCARATPPSAPRSARRSTSARARRSARTRSTQAIATQASQAVNEAYTKATTAFQSAEQTYEKLVVLAPKDPEHPARARPGSAAERRHGHRDRRISDLPEARPGRPERGDRQAADRSAEGRTGRALVGLDSPVSGKDNPIL